MRCPKFIHAALGSGRFPVPSSARVARFYFHPKAPCETLVHKSQSQMWLFSEHYRTRPFYFKTCTGKLSTTEDLHRQTELQLQPLPETRCVHSLSNYQVIENIKHRALAVQMEQIRHRFVCDLRL
jgi:hypothetical protein